MSFFGKEGRFEPPMDKDAPKGMKGRFSWVGAFTREFLRIKIWASGFSLRDIPGYQNYCQRGIRLLVPRCCKYGIEITYQISDRASAGFYRRRAIHQGFVKRIVSAELSRGCGDQSDTY